MPWPSASDYQEAIQNPSLCFADEGLKRGVPVPDPLGLPKAISGQFATVFQMENNGRRWAVRCFLRYHPDQQQRYNTISSYLQRIRLPYMVGFEFLQKGIRLRGNWYPILKMEWVDGSSLDYYLKDKLDRPDLIRELAKKFAHLVSDLRRYSIAHGDLQHGNILIANGEIRLVDYDGMYVPGLEGMRSHELGQRNYQHPKRTSTDFGPYLDNFSAWVIFVSLVALSADPSLWHRAGAGDERLLFGRDDFQQIESSQVLGLLEQTGRGEFRSIASLMRSIICCMDLREIPPLDTDEIESQVSVTSLPGWLQDHVRAGEVRQTQGGPQALQPAGSMWVLDHIISPVPVPPARAGNTDRAILAAFLVLSASLAALALAGLVPPVLTAPIFGAGLIALGVALRLRFRSVPDACRKLQAVRDLKASKNKINLINLELEAISKARKRLDDQKSQGHTKVLERQQRLRLEEQGELERVDAEVAKYQSRRTTLEAEQNHELANALHQIQSVFASNQLARYRIGTGSIPGIGQELSRRLAANGVRTAADFVDVHIGYTGWGNYANEVAYIEVPGRGRVRVEGIGPTRARALLDWRRQLESTVQTRAPQSLPPAQEATIRARYQVRLSELNRLEAEARHNAEQRKGAIRQAYRQKQDTVQQEFREFEEGLAAQAAGLEEMELAAKKRLSSAYWTRGTFERQVAALKESTFGAYVKSILFL